MKLIWKLILCFVVTLFFASCATHNGYLSSNAVITDNNFKIVGVGVGESQTSKIIGFGGLSQNALVYEAKKNLYANFPLKPGQALTNITVDFKHENYSWIYTKMKVIVTAEIVDFNPDTIQTPKNNYVINERFGFKNGEFIIGKKRGRYQQLKINRLDLYKVQVETTEAESIAVDPFLLRYDECFHTSGSFQYKAKNYAIGDTLVTIIEKAVNSRGESEPFEIKAVVVGIADHSALIRNVETNRYEKLNYDD
jgi:hypothetical protein